MATTSPDRPGFLVNLLQALPDVLADSDRPQAKPRSWQRSADAAQSQQPGGRRSTRDRMTREQRWSQLDEDLEYARPPQLDRSVVNPNQIRTVIRAFRDALPRNHHRAAEIDGRIVVLAGRDATISRLTTNEIYRPEEDRWERLPFMPSDRHGLDAAAVAGAIYVIAVGPEAGFAFSNRNEWLTPRE